jgi:DNA-binding NarL/FixJ family response regulator
LSGFRIEVLVVEDDSMVRSWVGLALDRSEFYVGCEAATTQEALEALDVRSPLLLLIDYRLPDRIGTELVRDVRLRGDSTPALLMTANPERGFNEAAREAGAQGTVLKSGRADELLAALRSALRGQPSFDPRHPRRAGDEAALSPREREVLRLVAEGATNREIAAELAVSSETVKTLLARTFSKLGVRRRAEAVSAAHGRGLL